MTPALGTAIPDFTDLFEYIENILIVAFLMTLAVVLVMVLFFVNGFMIWHISYTKRMTREGRRVATSENDRWFYVAALAFDLVAIAISPFILRPIIEHFSHS